MILKIQAAQEFLRRLKIGCSWSRPARKQVAARTKEGEKPAVKQWGRLPERLD